jgi:hypothetical protein
MMLMRTKNKRRRIKAADRGVTSLTLEGVRSIFTEAHKRNARLNEEATVDLIEQEMQIVRSKNVAKNAY